MNKKEKNVGGFTLMEVVITVSLVIILSLVSYPMYRQRTVDVRQAEAYALLGVIIDAQRNYYSDYGNFLYSRHSSAQKNYYTAKEDVLGINATNNRYFSWFSVNDYGTDGGVDERVKKYFVAHVRSGEKILSCPNVYRLTYHLETRFDIQSN